MNPWKRQQGSNPKIPRYQAQPPSSHAYYGYEAANPAPTPWTPQEGGGPLSVVPLKTPANDPRDPYANLLENIGKPADSLAQDLGRATTALNQMYPGWPAEKLMDELGPAAGLSKDQIPSLSLYGKIPARFEGHEGHPFYAHEEDTIFMPKKLPLSHWMGTLFHELRHPSDRKNRTWFSPDRNNQQNPDAYTAFAEQPNHFAGPHGDRAVAEMLTAQNIQRKSGRPIPQRLLDLYPHLKGKSPNRVAPLPQPENGLTIKGRRQ